VSYTLFEIISINEFFAVYKECMNLDHIQYRIYLVLLPSILVAMVEKY